jgi:xanthine phosphoribosyltransferase
LEKYYYGYDEFRKDAKQLVSKVSSYNPDTLLSIARGGLTLSHFMAQAMDTRRLFTLNSIHYDNTKRLDTFNIFNIPCLKDAKRVLIIDDIVDSGETMEQIFLMLRKDYPDVEFKLATIFYKTTAIVQPDFAIKQAYDWIDFFWEVDLIK